MSQINVWFGIPEDDHNTLNNRRGTAGNVGPAKAIVNGVTDPQVTQPLFSTRTRGQTVLHLWCVILDDRDGTFEAQVNAFRQEFPGVAVEGAWNPDGSPYGTTLVYEEVPNPNYDPVEYIGRDQDAEPPVPGTLNPDYDPYPTLTQVTVVGEPIYPQGNSLIDYMQANGEQLSLIDVHMNSGWAPRIFV